MRGAGCIINDLWDKNIDTHVARTKQRPIASGEITPQTGSYFLKHYYYVFLCCCYYSSNTATQILGLCSLLPISIYPLMKRFFPCPQLFLGFTFSWGALMGWVAVTGHFAWPMIWLYLAAICWTVGYDTYLCYAR